jgi:hypothetical protein
MFEDPSGAAPPGPPRSFRPSTVAPRRPLRPAFKNPDRDPRNLLADEFAAYAEPEYLNDVGFNLAKEVVALRAEVTHYRERLRDAINSRDCADAMPYIALPPFDREGGPDDLSNYIASMDFDRAWLDRAIADLRVRYSEETQTAFETALITAQQSIAETESVVASLTGEVAAAAAKLDCLRRLPLREDVGAAADRAQELRGILRTLKREERVFLDEHQALVIRGPKASVARADCARFQRQLQGVRRRKAMQLEAMRKMEESQKTQMQALNDALEENRRRGLEKQQTVAWREAFRQQQVEDERREQIRLAEQRALVRPPDGPRSSRRGGRRVAGPPPR